MKSTLSYAETQEKKRSILSFGMTIALYGFIFGMSLLYGVIKPREEVFSNMTVIVNLPGPIAPEPGMGSLHPSEKGSDSPAPQPATPDPKPAAPKSDPVKQVPPNPESPPVVPEKPSVLGFEPVVPVAVSAPPATTQTTLAEPWVPGERGPGSRQDGSTSSIYIPGVGTLPWTGVATIHKAEAGSTSDTYLGGAQGTVGQNIYVPIYYSLPLPRVVSATVYNAIPDLKGDYNTVIYTAQERKKTFSDYYEFDGTAYRLKGDLPLENREPFWQMLEDAGFNPLDADYRQGRTLNPVIIGFTVTKDRKLKGADILQSSGDPEIDRSLLYGFKRAQFYNKTGETIPGRFIYRF